MLVSHVSPHTHTQADSPSLCVCSVSKTRSDLCQRRSPLYCCCCRLLIVIRIVVVAVVDASPFIYSFIFFFRLLFCFFFSFRVSLYVFVSSYNSTDNLFTLGWGFGFGRSPSRRLFASSPCRFVCRWLPLSSGLAVAQPQLAGWLVGCFGCASEPERERERVPARARESEQPNGLSCGQRIE